MCTVLELPPAGAAACDDPLVELAGEFALLDPPQPASNIAVATMTRSELTA
jgi:hypothetical protein